jgi:hypothetical protein
VPQAPRLVCVARLSPEKGISILLRAAGQLAREGRPFELDLVGDGAQRAALESLALELGLGDRVRFAGWRSGAEVRERILDARALVLPSLSEGLPVVIMEALALRRPVIGTDVGGIGELVEPGVSAGSSAPAPRSPSPARCAKRWRVPPRSSDEMGRRGARIVAAAHDAAVPGPRDGGALRGTDRYRRGDDSFRFAEAAAPPLRRIGRNRPRVGTVRSAFPPSGSTHITAGERLVPATGRSPGVAPSSWPRMRRTQPRSNVPARHEGRQNAAAPAVPRPPGTVRSPRGGPRGIVPRSPRSAHAARRAGARVLPGVPARHDFQHPLRDRVREVPGTRAQPRRPRDAALLHDRPAADGRGPRCVPNV